MWNVLSGIPGPQIQLQIEEAKSEERERERERNPDYGAKFMSDSFSTHDPTKHFAILVTNVKVHSSVSCIAIFFRKCETIRREFS